MSEFRRINKLEVRDVPGAGLQIHADINFNPDFVEFVLKNGFQKIIEAREDAPLMAYEPWMPFPPDEWHDVLKQTFIEMVDAWNEKYGVVHE